MNEEKRKGAFIPCGDSLERMEALSDEALENVVGGLNVCAVPGEVSPDRPQTGSKAADWTGSKLVEWTTRQ